MDLRGQGRSSRTPEYDPEWARAFWNQADPHRYATILSDWAATLDK